MPTPRHLKKPFILTPIILSVVLLASGVIYYFLSSPSLYQAPVIDTGGLIQEISGQDSITTEVNAKAPGLASVSLDRQDIRSIDYIGNKVVLLEFWSVYCTSCIQEMPFMDDLYRRYKDSGLQVIGINTDYFGENRIRRFINRLEPQPSYPLIHDQDQSISKAFHVEALPVTVLIDSSGWIRMYHLGYKPEDRKTIENTVKKWVNRIRETVETVGPVDGKTHITVSNDSSITVGDLLPDEKSLDIDGKTVSLLEYRNGRAMILFFWSLFCQPCRQEMPYLSRIADRMGQDNSIVFMSVNLDTERLVGAVKKYMAKKPIAFPTLLDAIAEPSGSIAGKLSVSYTPTLVMIDREGIVREILVGALSPEKLESHIEMFADSLKSSAYSTGSR